MFQTPLLIVIGAWEMARSTAGISTQTGKAPGLRVTAVGFPIPNVKTMTTAPIKLMRFYHVPLTNRLECVPQNQKQ